MFASLRLTPQLARERALRATEVLAADPRVQLVFLFGSAVDPGRPVVRDVDLAIWTEPPLSLDELLHLRADAIERAGPGLDLVSLNRAPIVLAHEVAQTGECLYAIDPDLRVEFLCKALREYLDWKPFRDVQWRYAGERLEARRGSRG
ncbi:MAG TPA: nucleotidyltransferase domain-containing protein [Thermoanaerobaculia bacterium]|nr:nucleotidyltransferase domain-containing protein [Thermoanaerobaculia bacterium]